MKKMVIRVSLLSSLLVLLIVLINAHIVSKTESQIYRSIEDIPEKQAVIVLGAFVRGDKLSHVLEQRVKAGTTIYVNEQASKILLSGDHGQVEYDEVNSMRKYVLSNYSTVKPNDVFMDHAGFDTYDSMYRAKEIFEVESAVIVTQEFHINRAVYIANELGIDAVGYAVNEEIYPTYTKLKWRLRESLSRVKAYGDLLLKSKPKYLGDIIPITGDGRLSWDELEN